MPNTKTVKDMMIDVFEYPHMPYWFTIRQAIGIIKNSLIKSDKCIHPQAVLVFDEKYNLMGVLTLKEILEGLEPRFLKPSTKAQGISGAEEDLSAVWASLFPKECKERAESPVSNVMIPVKSFVSPDDEVAKAAYHMVHDDLMLLPVIKGGKLMGIIRMIEVFQEVSDVVLKD